ncbi:hypothetical protein BVX94_03845, partial [bacterium B17]
MKRIVAIDDEPEILKCLENALKTKGYTLTITNDPEAGLEILKAEDDISLALLDIRMPKKNGFELYRELREVRKLPVLFVTAFTKSFSTKSNEVLDMWQSEFADGTTDIIYKPFTLESLFEKVE